MTTMRLEDKRGRCANAVTFGSLDPGTVYTGVGDKMVYLCVFLDGMRHLVELSRNVGNSVRFDDHKQFVPLKSTLVIQHE